MAGRQKGGLSEITPPNIYRPVRPTAELVKLQNQLMLTGLVEAKDPASLRINLLSRRESRQITFLGREAVSNFYKLIEERLSSARATETVAVEHVDSLGQSNRKKLALQLKSGEYENDRRIAVLTAFEIIGDVSDYRSVMNFSIGNIVLGGIISGPERAKATARQFAPDQVTLEPIVIS
jgi:hypothetical protein